MKSFTLLLVSVALALLGYSEAFLRAGGGVTELRNIVIEKEPPAFPRVFEVRASRKNVNTKTADAVDFVFGTEWIPRFVLRYFHRNSDKVEALAARWGVWKLIEYQENPLGNPGFEPGVDTILSSYRTWARVYDPMTITNRVNAAGATVWSVCSKNSFGPPTINFCANFVDRQTTSPNSTDTQDPNFVKWSIDIDNYPYNGTQSRLALKVAFESKFAALNLTGADAPADPTHFDGITLGGASSQTDPNSRALISWVKTVNVTGTGCSATAPVVRSVIFEGQSSFDLDTLPSGDTDGLVDLTLRVSYFSFLTDCADPTQIRWDPDFGVAGDMSPATTLAVSLASLFVLLVVSLL